MADRNDPMVQAWIHEYARVTDTKREDCYLCGWPHASNGICNVSTFGLAVIGGEHYSVRGQNVDSLLRFRRSGLPRGFHWRNDICFERTEEGVRISRIEQFNNTPQIKAWVIPALEWESIVNALGVAEAQTDWSKVPPDQWPSKCPKCGAGLSYTSYEPYCAYADCRWNNAPDGVTGAQGDKA